jgi:hypothetical protein
VKQDISSTKDKAVDKKSSKDKPVQKKEDSKKKEEDAKKKKTYSLWDFAKFTLPFLWRGGFMIKF